MEGETVTLQEIFYFEQSGVDGQGAVKEGSGPEASTTIR